MSRPNIILLLADEHRWDCTGYAGNPDLRTPNLDALAAHGVNFSQATCPFPLCVPSRSSLLTGQYASTHGVMDNRTGVPTDVATLPGCLQAAEYNTACVGKMHFVPPRAQYGFDLMRLAEQDGPGRFCDDYHEWLKRRGRIDQVDLWDQVDRAAAPPEYWETLGAMTSDLPEELHSTTWVGNEAVRFIQRAREPFFLWAGFVKPHHPFDPPQPWDRLYEPKKLTLPGGWTCPVPEDDAQHGGHFDPRQMTEERFRRVLAYYYATISHLDHQVGRILATLTSRGFTNNVIVYCADHGDYMGQHGLILKGGARPYDALVRVPLVVAGLAGQRRGQADPALAQLVDIMPTLLDVAGVKVPECVEGRSLVPLLRQPDITLREAAFVEAANGVRVLRTLRHKLIESGDRRICALYDLEKDPFEYDNVYGKRKFARIHGEATGRLAAFVERNRSQKKNQPGGE